MAGVEVKPLKKVNKPYKIWQKEVLLMALNKRRLKPMSVSVTVNTTPNEHALKFSVNKNILDSGYKTFNNMEEAKDFPLAAKIFENADVASIFFMAETEGGFISVTKKPEANWNDLKDKILANIKAVL